MIDEIARDINLEKKILAGFGVKIGIKKIILNSAPVSRSAVATVFISEKKKPYVYISSQSRLKVADVRYILSRMGLKVGGFAAPKGQMDYFAHEATKKFLEVFPGRKQVNDEDLTYYKTLGNYSPVFAPIIEVKDGVIKMYDDDTRGKWRPGIKYAYRQISTK